MPELVQGTDVAYIYLILPDIKLIYEGFNISLVIVMKRFKIE